MSESNNTACASEVTLVLEGNLITSTVTPLRTKIKQIITDGARTLVMDMTKCQVLDSSGIGLLVATYNSLARVGGSVNLIHVSPDIRELLQTMRLEQYLSIEK